MSNGDRPQGSPAPRISRRIATTTFGAVAGSAIAGCGDDNEIASGGGGGAGGAGTGSGSTAGSTANAVGSTGTSGSPTAQASVGAGGGEGGAGGQGAGGGGGSGGGEGGAGQGGEANECAATSDLTPEELLAPIDTFVILCMENRSFDHYLGALTLVEGRPIDGLTGAESNPDGLGGDVPSYLLEDFTPDDPPHDWDAAHAQFDGGANDGFVTEYGGTAVMGYHVRDQIPITYALADASAICDRYFCSVLGPTWPNRFYLHGATSNGQKANSPSFGFNPIWDLLDDAGLSGVNFYHDLAWASGGYAKFSGNEGIESFFDKASLANLPNVSIIDPQFFGDGANDDHPDHHIALGQALIASVYAALAQSTQWSRCMLIVTYDENGGFFDHVVPPAAVDEREEFAQYGFRVPTLVTGPFVRRGCAVSEVYDHASILKTIAVRFGLPMLTDRMEAAADLSACIDPGALQNPHSPVVLPEAPVPIDAIFSGRTEPTIRPLHHQELWDLAESGAIPAHLDRRAEGDRIAKHVLEMGRRLGAVRLVRTR